MQIINKKPKNKNKKEVLDNGVTDPKTTDPGKARINL